ncbi:hypothetical protein FNH22_05575 [Fulvivirga sp. M361]|uniref:NAD(P)-binding domain-containing protein n=1 Tax=Fulvivirga sp. M361 TaxID=2594266 RepID=UPI00117A3608|nr:NAD(P)-binding domain-containing protein [Fulvivirga sp. M361]TRX60520.1 hypothetical protein FNH22_05575 [Fulvivirga sp. M361]
MNKNFEVAIIGAGPIGLEMAISLKSSRVSYIHFEAFQLGHTINQWPQDAFSHNSPEQVTIGGIPLHLPDQQLLTKDTYLAYLRQVVELCALHVNTYERVLAVKKSETGYEIKTDRSIRDYTVKKIILATGNVYSPNTIDIPGIQSDYIRYDADNIHQYFKTKVLIVGGGNAALKAALQCFRIGASVTISYRQKSFDEHKIKPEVLVEIHRLISKKLIRFIPGSHLVKTINHEVWLKTTYGEKKLFANFILLRIGHRANMDFFKKIGITLQGKEEKPQIDQDSMETNLPEVFIIGSVLNGHEYGLEIHQCHDHVDKVLKALQLPTPPATDLVSHNHTFRQ